MRSMSWIPWYVRRGAEIARDENIMKAGATLMREITGRLRYQWLKIMNPNGYCLRNIQNNKIYLSVDDEGISRDLLIRGIRERMETRMMQQILKPGMKIIDIGANIGYYALMEALAVTETGHVYAFEPEPRNFELLSRNIEINGYRNIDVFPMAISDESGLGMLYVSKYYNRHSLLPPVEPTESKIPIEIHRLDDFVAERGINPSNIDLIRMDIEGYEVKALAGMTEILRAAKALILVIEFHPQYIRNIANCSFESVMEMLADLGFGTIRYATALARGGGTLQFRNITTSDFLADERVSRDHVLCAFLNKDTVTEYLSMGDIRKLNLGCGLITPKGWINLDGSWNAWLSKYPVVRRLLKVVRLVPADSLGISWNRDTLIHDVRTPLPFENDYLTAIYASHLLEHLYLEEARHLLRECLRVLRPGGVLRVVVPDMNTLVTEYIREKQSQNRTKELSPADRLNRRLGYHDSRPSSGTVIYRLYKALTDFDSHKWMYDVESFIHHARQAGFVDVQEMQFRQSRIDGIDEVEQPERVLNGEGVCVEGIKPISTW